MTITRYRKTAAAAAGAALLVAGLVAGAHAQDEARPGRRGFGPGGPRSGGFPLAQLELTDTQRQQIREATARHRDEMRQAAVRLREAHEAQRKAVETLPVNEGLIRSTSEALAAAQTDMALARARAHEEVWALLTPEQQARAKELRTQRENRMKERRRQ